MPEHASHREAVRAGAPVTIGLVTLLPIERVVVHTFHGRSGWWFSAAKQPFALILRDAAGMRALDAEAAVVPLNRLCESVPGLEALLAGM